MDITVDCGLSWWQTLTVQERKLTLVAALFAPTGQKSTWERFLRQWFTALAVRVQRCDGNTARSSAAVWHLETLIIILALTITLAVTSVCYTNVLYSHVESLLLLFFRVKHKRALICAQKHELSSVWVYNGLVLWSAVGIKEHRCVLVVDLCLCAFAVLCVWPGSGQDCALTFQSFHCRITHRPTTAMPSVVLLSFPLRPKLLYFLLFHTGIRRLTGGWKMWVTFIYLSKCYLMWETVL